MAKDEVRAIGLWQQACTGGVASACTSLGIHFNLGWGVAKDQVRAASLYQQACTGGHALGCADLGDLYRDGQGVTKDTARALQLYRQALTLKLLPSHAQRIQTKINDLTAALGQQ